MRPRLSGNQVVDECLYSFHADTNGTMRSRGGSRLRGVPDGPRIDGSQETMNVSLQ